MADTDILLSEREVSDWANDWTLQHRIIYQTAQINTLFQLVYLVFWFVYFMSLALW